MLDVPTKQHASVGEPVNLCQPEECGGGLLSSAWQYCRGIQRITWGWDVGFRMVENGFNVHAQHVCFW